MKGLAKINAALNEAERTGKPVDIGRVVVCDVCNTDYTDSPAIGGFLFGSYGYCPACAEKEIRSIRQLGEDKFIKAIAREDERFCDFILRMRGGNNTVRVTKLNL